MIIYIDEKQLYCPVQHSNTAFDGSDMSVTACRSRPPNTFLTAVCTTQYTSDTVCIRNTHSVPLRTTGLGQLSGPETKVVGVCLDRDSRRTHLSVLATRAYPSVAHPMGNQDIVVSTGIGYGFGTIMPQGVVAEWGFFHGKLHMLDLALCVIQYHTAALHYICTL